MAWVYLDDNFPDHPKVAAAGGDAAWLFVCGLAYIKRYTTEGVIPKGRISQLSDRKQSTRLARKLVEVGLWVDDGNSYKVHDYHDWNKPQESRSAAGRKAARARWGSSDGNANGNADALRDACESDSEVDASGHASECPPPHPLTNVLNKANARTHERPVDKSGGRASLIAAAAERVARAECGRRLEQGDQISNPDGYIRSRAAPLAAQHAPHWNELLDRDVSDAYATAQALADSVTVTVPKIPRVDPHAEQQAIAIAAALEHQAEVHEMLAEPPDPRAAERIAALRAQHHLGTTNSEPVF